MITISFEKCIFGLGYSNPLFQNYFSKIPSEWVLAARSDSSTSLGLTHVWEVLNSTSPDCLPSLSFKRSTRPQSLFLPSPLPCVLCPLPLHPPSHRPNSDEEMSLHLNKLPWVLSVKGESRGCLIKHFDLGHKGMMWPPCHHRTARGTSHAHTRQTQGLRSPSRTPLPMSKRCVRGLRNVHRVSLLVLWMRKTWEASQGARPWSLSLTGCAD